MKNGRNLILLISFSFLQLVLMNVPVAAQDTAAVVEVVPVAPPVTLDSVYEDEDYDNEFELPLTTADSVQWKNFPPGYIDSLKNDEAFGYVKNGIPKPEQKKKAKEKSKPFTFNEIIPYIAIAVFVAFIIWYLISNNIVVFRKKSTAAIAEQEEFDENEDIFSIEYRQAIQKALANKNYRLAIRLHYLQLLRKLSDKNIINYRPDRTNFDYLMQLRPTDYYNDFFTATRNYEYSWYGLFNISEEQYKKIEKAFDDFLKRV